MPVTSLASAHLLALFVSAAIGTQASAAPDGSAGGREVGEPLRTRTSPPAGVIIGGERPPSLTGATDRSATVRRGVIAPGCVSPDLAAWVRAEASRNRAMLGVTPPSVAGAPMVGAASGGVAGADPLYRFYPMAGQLGVDTMNGGFVDLDPTPGAIDYACRPFTYDGHEGIDTEIRSFGEQFVGVPVFAARPGTVVFAQDGWPDTNIFGGVQGNIVVIDHGDGYESQYYHLKKDSVTVSVGALVEAGTQIGQVGSSGNSFGPHLHFQTMQWTGSGWIVVEPFAGACRPGESEWSEQAPLDTDALFLHDFGITRTDLFTLPEPWWTPWPLPTDAQIQLDDSAVVFWWRVFNFPTDCEIRVRFFRPDNSLAWDAQWTWGNEELWRIHKNWFAFDLPAMGPTPGTWRLRFELDGQLMIDTPFEVVAAVDPSFNRPPSPVTVTIDPAQPTSDDVIFCRVSSMPALEDPDWDIVRYRYRWSVNGQVVRDIVSAAQSDAIPALTAPAGALVECEVTPGDGVADGPPALASVIVSGGLIPGDLDGDGTVTGADLGLMLGAWGPCDSCGADLDGNGIVNGADLGVLLGSWG